MWWCSTRLGSKVPQLACDMTRLETIAWCLLPVAMTAAGCGVVTVLAALFVAILVRWIGAEIIGAFASVFSSISRSR